MDTVRFEKMDQTNIIKGNVKAEMDIRRRNKREERRLDHFVEKLEKNRVNRVHTTNLDMNKFMKLRKSRFPKLPEPHFESENKNDTVLNATVKLTGKKLKAIRENEQRKRNQVRQRISTRTIYSRKTGETNSTKHRSNKTRTTTESKNDGNTPPTETSNPPYTTSSQYKSKEEPTRNENRFSIETVEFPPPQFQNEQDAIRRASIVKKVRQYNSAPYHSLRDDYIKEGTTICRRFNISNLFDLPTMEKTRLSEDSIPKDTEYVQLHPRLLKKHHSPQKFSNFTLQTYYPKASADRPSVQNVKLNKKLGLTDIKYKGDCPFQSKRSLYGQQRPKPITNHYQAFVKVKNRLTADVNYDKNLNSYQFGGEDEGDSSTSKKQEDGQKCYTTPLNVVDPRYKKTTGDRDLEKLSQDRKESSTKFRYHCERMGYIKAQEYQAKFKNITKFSIPVSVNRLKLIQNHFSSDKSSSLSNATQSDRQSNIE